MKLGDNGEAFFVEENENMEVTASELMILLHYFVYISFVTHFSFQSQVPAHLCTSPITIEVTEDVDECLEGSSSVAGSGARRKKRRRKRIRSDTHLRDDNSSSDEREREKESERGENGQTGQQSPAEQELLSPLHVR